MAYVVIQNIAGKEGVEVNQTKTLTGVSDVTIELSNGQTYRWSPGESHTLLEPYASEALSASESLVEVSRS